MNHLDPYSQTYYHRFDVQMSATRDVSLEAWPGAIVRNNLLYAAEQVRIQKTGRSLREQIDTFPLDNAHPLYKELKEGFPKAYVLTYFSHTDMTGTTVSIHKGEVFSFSLLLIGRFNDYRYYFFEAIREMCERGIGKPLTPFQLLAISENPASPVSLSDFMSQETDNKSSEITLRFQTPVILYRLKEKKNTQISYQDKSNRFPGFYQLTRSALSRLQKLHALYVEPTDDSPLLFEESLLETYLETAGRPLLQSATIQHINLPNTPKKGMKNEMPLAGYIGEQKYAGYFRQYLPLLKFMAELGVGNEVVYGMGRYEVEEQCSTNRIDKNQKIEVENEVKTLDSFIDLEEAGLDENYPSLLKISRLIVRFKNQISQRDIPLFVEAVAKEAIKNNNLLHKHLVSGNQYCYPVIQFKRINGQAAIICIGEGTESIGGFFSSTNGKMTVGEKEVALEIETVKAEKILIQAWDTNFAYTIRKYLPLSNDKYAEYQKINETNIRYEFLEKILKANLLMFTKSIGIHLDKEIICTFAELEEKAMVKYKNHTFMSFDLKFRTNVSLPDYIGLGIGVGHGFGMVVRVRSQKNN